MLASKRDKNVRCFLFYPNENSTFYVRHNRKRTPEYVSFVNVFLPYAFVKLFSNHKNGYISFTDGIVGVECNVLADARSRACMLVSSFNVLMILFLFILESGSSVYTFLLPHLLHKYISKLSTHFPLTFNRVFPLHRIQCDNTPSSSLRLFQLNFSCD